MSDRQRDEAPSLAELSAWDLPEYEVDRLLATGDDARLRSLFGADYEELRKLAREAAKASRVRRRKTIIFLPGILGSSLGLPRKFIGNDTIWFDPVSLAWGDAKKLKLNASSKVKSLGVVPIYHNMIRLRLTIAGFRVVSFHYDWRRSIAELGQLLVDFVENDRSDEVSLVAHSMGGLVSRAAWAIGSDKFKKLVMLGTPNRGSFSPVQVLQGVNSTVQMVARLERGDPVELVKSTFSSFPAVYEMLPRPEVFDEIDLFQRSNWPTKPYRPTASRLKAVEDTWEQIADPDDDWHLIAGFGQPTVTDLRTDDNGDFEYLVSADGGDGTVPLSMCQLPDVPTRYVVSEHVSMLGIGEVAQAVGDLVNQGETDRLLPAPTMARSAQGEWVPQAVFDAGKGEVAPTQRGGASVADSAAVARSALSFSSLPMPSSPPSGAAPGRTTADHVADSPAAVPAGENLLEDVSLKETFVSRDLQSQVDIELVNQSLFALPYRAIVLGIFEDVDPGGPANELNRLTNGAVQELIDRRMFDGSLGRVFVMPTGRNLLKCEHVVFMGLGRFADFVETPDQVLRATSSNLLRTLLYCGVDEFATVVYGGSSGLPIRDAVKSMICGYLESIQQLSAQETGIAFRRLGLCEIDQQRYAELKHEVVRFAFTDDAKDMRIRLHEPAYSGEYVAKPRAAATADVPRDEIALSMAYFSARLEADDEEPGDLQLHASLLTSGGSAAVYPSHKRIDGDELDQLIARASSVPFDKIDSLGEELSELLFEDGFLNLLANNPIRADHTAVIHNTLASRIPWEILKLGKDKFPCLESGVSRRHELDGEAVARFARDRQRSDILNILLIVDPTKDLPGAVAEGKVIREIAGNVNRTSITVLFQEEATRGNVLDELGSGSFDVMHYAGHAFFDPEDRKRSGLLCADATLRSTDLEQLEQLPSLVFFNACESGRVRKRDNANRQPTMSERREQNFGVAEAMLRGGVTQFLGTYWPVGDAPAKKFAESFYRSLTNGDAVYHAVAKGRKQVFAADSIDFANYLHYGSPTFRVKLRS